MVTVETVLVLIEDTTHCINYYSSHVIFKGLVSCSIL